MIHSVSIKATNVNPYFRGQSNDSPTPHHDHTNCGHDHDHHHHPHPQPANHTENSSRGPIMQRFQRVATWFKEIFSSFITDIKTMLKGPDEHAQDSHDHNH